MHILNKAPLRQRTYKGNKLIEHEKIVTKEA